MIGLGTYVSERVQVVVGQFQLLEGDQLPHPVRACGGRVRVYIEPPGHGRLCLPGHRPESQQHSHTVTPCTDTHISAINNTGAICKMLIRPHVLLHVGFDPIITF